VKSKNVLRSAGIAVLIAVLGASAAISAQDKYTLKMSGGLAFAEFRDFEDWQTVAVSQDLCQLGAVREFLAFSGSAGSVGVDHHGIGEDHLYLVTRLSHTVVANRDYVFTAYGKR